MRDIAGDRVRPAARGADLGGGQLDLAARARGEPDFGAGLSEGDGAGAADAAAGAGDEGGAAFEAEARADVHAGDSSDSGNERPRTGAGPGCPTERAAPSWAPLLQPRGRPRRACWKRPGIPTRCRESHYCCRWGGGPHRLAFNLALCARESTLQLTWSLSRIRALTPIPIRKSWSVPVLARRSGRRSGAGAGRPAPCGPRSARWYKGASSTRRRRRSPRA